MGTYTNLGYFVPTGFTAAAEQAKKFYSRFDDVAQVIRTGPGNVIPFLRLANCYGRADFTGAAQVNWLSLSERIR